jgi:hypothetical protein
MAEAGVAEEHDAGSAEILVKSCSRRQRAVSVLMESYIPTYSKFAGGSASKYAWLM